MKNSKFSEKISKYISLAIALVAVEEINGQIIYTDIEPDSVGGFDSFYILDLDNNGDVDYNFVNNASVYYTSYSPDPIINSNRLVLYNISNSVLGSNESGGLYFPYALDEGSPISNGLNQWISASSVDIQNSSSCLNGGICNVTDKYLGLRFKIDNNTHYGWVRIDVGNTPDSYTIKDYAYNVTPDEPINAGQLTLSISDNIFDDFNIIVSNKFIIINNLLKKANYIIYSLTGQIIIKGNLFQQHSKIGVDELSKGIYIIRLEDEITGEVLVKRIIL